MENVVATIRRIRFACILTALMLWPQLVHAGEDVFFERKIRPILAGTCFKCHGGERIGGKLHVDSRAALLKGGRSGPALVPGDSDKSLLVQALRHTKGVEPMPPAPGKKLSDEAIADFALWAKNGRSLAGQSARQRVHRRQALGL